MDYPDEYTTLDYYEEYGQSDATLAEMMAVIRKKNEQRHRRWKRFWWLRRKLWLIRQVVFDDAEDDE